MKSDQNTSYKTKCIEDYDKVACSESDRSRQVYCFNKQSHYMRLHEVVSLIDTMSSSVLDVGCGNGEFLRVLNCMGFTGGYAGVDINQNLIESAKAIYPGSDFNCIDILESDVEKKDYVVLCAIFNKDHGQGFDFVAKFIDRCFALCKKGVIINAISTYVNFKDEEMFYLDPLKVVDHALRNLSPSVTLKHGYLPYNYSVLINQPTAWERLNIVE